MIPSRPMSFARSRGNNLLVAWLTRLRVKHLVDSVESLIVRRNVERAGGIRFGSVRTTTHEQELRMLYKLARMTPRGSVALELGSYAGGASCYLAAGLRSSGGKLVCVDTWQNDAMTEGSRDTSQEFLQNVAGFGDAVIALRKNSDELRREDLPGALDLVFIDGDHSYDAVRRDVALLEKWLSPKATVAFHDANSPRHPGVSKAIGDLLASGEWMLQGQVYGLVMLKKVS